MYFKVEILHHTSSPYIRSPRSRHVTLLLSWLEYPSYTPNLLYCTHFKNITRNYVSFTIYNNRENNIDLIRYTSLNSISLTNYFRRGTFNVESTMDSYSSLVPLLLLSRTVHVSGTSSSVIDCLRVYQSHVCHSSTSKSYSDPPDCPSSDTSRNFRYRSSVVNILYLRYPPETSQYLSLIIPNVNVKLSGEDDFTSLI